MILRGVCYFMELIFGAFVVMFGWFLIFIIPAFIMYIIGLSFVFKKAGKKGWEAIVPFYSTWVLNEISGLAWWYALVIIFYSLRIVDEGYLGEFVLLLAIVSNFFICYNLSKKFNRGIGTAILMFLFPFVMFPVMGFSADYIYDDKVVVSENGPIEFDKNGNKYSEQEYYNEKHYCQYCGQKISSEAKFCSNCGNELK